MGLVDWWNSRKQEPVVSTTSSPRPASEGEVDPSTDNADNADNADNVDNADNAGDAGNADNTDNVDNADNASESSQPQDVAEDQNEEQEQEVESEPKPEPKKGFLERFSLFKKNLPPEDEITPMGSEDVFSPPRKKIIEIDKNSEKGKKSRYEDNSPSVEDFVRVKVWLRRNRKEPFRPAKFCDCLVDYFAYADAKNIYSAPPIQLPGSTLNTPQSGGSLKDPSDKTSLHSSSEYLTWSGISTPFGCCSVNRSPLPSSTRSSSNHSCCLHSPKTEAISVTVECVLQDNRVLMQPAPEDAIVDRHQGKKRQAGIRPNSAHSFIAVLEHPAFCCAHRISPKDYTALPEEDKQRGVDVGVAVLLESSDQRLLITRRAHHMRTFPGLWVPPGGHIDDGETVIEAGMREIFEETGLCLSKGKESDAIFLKLPKSDAEGNSQEDSNEALLDEEANRYSLLGLWESCFPPVLYAGTPKKQHLVYYLHVVLSQPADVINKHLKLQRSEVGACAWLDRSHAEVVGYSSRPLSDAPIPITEFDPDSDTMVPGTMDPKVLRKKMPEPTKEIERLTTGTRFALKLWLGPHDDPEISAPSTPEQ